MPGENNDLNTYKNSVLKVYGDGFEYNYRYPWQGPTSNGWGGSGFVVNYNGKPYVITNAHVTADASQLDVRIASDNTKYSASVRNVDHDCDLAMLEIEDPKFWEKVEPLELGEMPALQDKLKVVGFPLGGNEMCITKGIVSRNEVGSYCHSDVEHIHTQVSAEINPGNSGGPAIYNGKVLGVAFQGIGFADGIGYIIPAPVLKHFIQDSLAAGPYKGFPNLAFKYQTMDNQYMREEYGLKEGETGIRIQSIDKLSSAYEKLKEDDVILAIDGHKVQNDGTVETEIGNRIKFIHLIRSKHIGDSITVDILRNGERINVDVPLLNRTHTTKLAQKEWDKAPTYFIHSGIAFTPATPYLNSTRKFKYKEKSFPGEEKVLLHTILSSDYTRGVSRQHEQRVVEKVNGKEIQNLKDLIAALEGNEGSRHRIELKGGAIVIVKNLSELENNEVLKRLRIASDRSEDLSSPTAYKPGCPEYNSFTPAFRKEVEKFVEKLSPKQNEEQAQNSQTLRLH